MFKMGLHCSFKHLKHKLWPKEGPRVKLVVWLPTTKSQESTWSTWLQRACNIPSERSWWELQLCFRSHLNQRFARKVMGSKVAGIPTWPISGLPFGSSGTKSHLDVASVKSHKVYYKGEGGGFPQVRAVVSLMCPCCWWFVLASKVLQLCTNHLVWVLCRPVWVDKACQLFLIPSRSSSTPLYPSKCCELGTCFDSSLFRCFLLGLTFELVVRQFFF
jgi:hypothetical protein